MNKIVRMKQMNYVFCQLEEVMETETYKNAKLILERFDPESKKKAVSIVICIIKALQGCRDLFWELAS